MHKNNKQEFSGLFSIILFMLACLLILGIIIGAMTLAEHRDNNKRNHLTVLTVDLIDSQKKEYLKNKRYLQLNNQKMFLTYNLNKFNYSQKNLSSRTMVFTVSRKPEIGKILQIKAVLENGYLKDIICVNMKKCLDIK